MLHTTAKTCDDIKWGSYIGANRPRDEAYKSMLKKAGRLWRNDCSTWDRNSKRFESCLSVTATVTLAKNWQLGRCLEASDEPIELARRSFSDPRWSSLLTSWNAAWLHYLVMPNGHLDCTPVASRCLEA